MCIHNMEKECAIVIFGYDGYIGLKLTEYLMLNGYKVVGVGKEKYNFEKNEQFFYEAYNEINIIDRILSLHVSEIIVISMICGQKKKHGQASNYIDYIDIESIVLNLQRSIQTRFIWFGSISELRQVFLLSKYGKGKIAEREHILKREVVDHYIILPIIFGDNPRMTSDLKKFTTFYIRLPALLKFKLPCIHINDLCKLFHRFISVPSYDYSRIIMFYDRHYFLQELMNNDFRSTLSTLPVKNSKTIMVQLFFISLYKSLKDNAFDRLNIFIFYLLRIPGVINHYEEVRTVFLNLFPKEGTIIFFKDDLSRTGL